MRILQVHNFYRIPGGECSVVRAEQRLLAMHGHEVELFSADSGETVDYTFARKAMALMQIPYSFVEARRLERLVRRLKPDVAHIHNVFPILSPSVYQTLRRCRIPVVQTIHNFRFLCPNGLFFTHGHVCRECTTAGFRAAVRYRCVRDSRVISALYAAAIGLAWRTGNLPGSIDRYVALNKFGADLLSGNGIPQERIRICGNFVWDFAPTPPTKKPYFLYLGRLSPEKGLRTLMAAIKRTTGIALRIAGTGPLEAELRDYASGELADRVTFSGFVTGESKNSLVAQAIATIVPSEWYENFPISVVESLAAGTPVIASRIGGLPEMIEHGSSGMLVEAGNVDELATAISMLAANEGVRKRMSAAALASARSRFGPESHYEQLIGIYNELGQSHAKTERRSS